MLDTALRPLIAALNRQIKAKSPARDLCKSLHGKSMAIRVRDTALSACLEVDSEGISLGRVIPDEPDVAITGSLLTLLQLGRSGSEDLFRGGGVHMVGDAHLAQQFQKLLKLARPEPEEELSRLVGDVAAHGIGDLARGFGRWSRNARQSLSQNVTEYLQEESEVLPRRYDVERFRTQVEILRDDVARFEARLRQFESRVHERGEN
ncbi:MAG: SCP2 sterol-binding domain-containing protein [Woeseiaceae bacterium]